MFWKFVKYAEVSGTWKVQLNDSKSCIVNFCYCSFTANFLPSSYFSINFLVRVGKMLFNNENQAKKWNKYAFQMQVVSSTVSSPNGIGAKFLKYVRSERSPSSSPVKKQFAGHVSGCLCKWLDWFYQCEDFTLCFTSYFLQV